MSQIAIMIGISMTGLVNDHDIDVQGNLELQDGFSFLLETGGFLLLE